MPSLHAVMDRFFRQPYATTTSTDSAARFATSWLFSPVVFTFWRAAISFYAFSVLFVSIALEATHGGDQLARRSFGYFTILGYWGLAFYFAVAAFHSGSVWRRGRARLESWPRWLRFAHSCFYSSVVVFPILVTSEIFFLFEWEMCRSLTSSKKSSSGPSSQTALFPPASTHGPTSPSTPSIPSLQSLRLCCRGPHRCRGLTSASWSRCWVAISFSPKPSTRLRGGIRMTS